MAKRRIEGALFAAMVALAGYAPAVAGPDHALTIASVPVALDANSPGRDQVGKLRYLGGLALTSSEKSFGGLSSLRWNGGHLYALSDQDGAWFTIVPVEDKDRLVGIGPVRATRLLGTDGRPLSGKHESDAESMNLVRARCRIPPCSATGVTVGFERNDRILTWRLKHDLPVGRPRRLNGADAWLARQPDNLGVEAMAGNAAVTLLISEGLRTPLGAASALLFRPGLNGRERPIRAPIEIGVPAPGEARPSELAQIDDRRFILLRRSWSAAAGFAVDVEQLTLAGDRATALPLARLISPLITDNYEGAAIRRESGRIFLYLISEDNFASDQRRLLLKFVVVG